jgi:hypothetical protein
MGDGTKKAPGPHDPGAWGRLRETAGSAATQHAEGGDREQQAEGDQAVGRSGRHLEHVGPRRGRAVGALARGSQVASSYVGKLTAPLQPSSRLASRLSFVLRAQAARAICYEFA